MSDKTPLGSLIAVGMITTAVVAAAAYAGYKAFKAADDIDLDNIFDDLNETFYSNYPGKKK